jgi:hypothetical protein
MGALPTATIGEMRKWDAWGGGSLRFLEAAYRTDDWNFTETPGGDSRGTSWSASVLPVRHREDAWLVGWRERRLGAGDTASIVSRAAVVGHRRRLSALLWLDLEAGAVDVKYGDGTRHKGPAGGITLSGGEAEPGLLTPRVHVWQDVATNVTAEVGHRIGNGHASLRWASLADVQGGIYRDPTYVQELAATARDTVARATTLSLEAGYGRTRSLHVAAPQVELVRASGWLSRRVRPWLTGRAGCTYLKQAGVNSSSILALRRIRWEVAFAAHTP